MKDKFKKRTKRKKKPLVTSVAERDDEYGDSKSNTWEINAQSVDVMKNISVPTAKTAVSTHASYRWDMIKYSMNCLPEGSSPCANPAIQKYTGA